MFAVYVCSARALTLTLVLTTGLITIFILVISVIGKWSVVCVRAREHTQTNTTTRVRKDQVG